MSYLIGLLSGSNNLKDLLMIDLLYTDWRLTGSENFHCPLVSENQTTTLNLKISHNKFQVLQCEGGDKY